MLWLIALCLQAFLQFLWIYWAAHRMGMTLVLRKPVLTPNVRRLMKAMGPGILAGSVIQINLLSDVILASPQEPFHISIMLIALINYRSVSSVLP